MKRAHYIIIFTSVLTLAVSQISQVCLAGPEPSGAGTRVACRTIPDKAARLRCFENAATSVAQAPSISTKPLEGWRLVRTPNPGGGDDAISIMRTADALRSDPDFAGLTVLCGQHGLEIRIIVIQPLPPRSRPTVTLGGANSEIRFEATVVPPGAALQLPGQAAALVKGPWQALQELPIKVEQGDTTIHGIIPLSGLGNALQTLMASCTAH